MITRSLIFTVILFIFSFPVFAVDTDSDSLPDAWESANARDPAVPDYLVDAGWNTSCGLDDNGVSCWGVTTAGQGNIPALTNVRQVAAGTGHVCALDDTGVVCWGSAASGKTSPPAMTGVTKISSLLHHTCAVHDGGVSCWGVNTNGQNDVPPQLNSPVDVAAGSNHSCALGSNGVFCWGLNTSGQTNVPALSNPVAVAAGGSHSCAIDDNGVACWGGNGQGQLNVPLLDTPVAIDAGSAQTCVVDTVLGVVCWGQDNYSQSSGVPAMVNPVTVSTGQQHNCALADGGIYCWGRDVEGQSDTSALVIDPDGDGIESDVDACPLLDNAVTDTDGDCIGDVDDPDDDNDGLTDIEESGLGTDPLSADTDNDGITDYDEVNVWGTNPLVVDLDNDADGIPDAADADDDNDTWPDVEDPFPFDQTKPIIALHDSGRYVFHGQEGDPGDAGWAVSAAGDVNNDGYDDYMVGYFEESSSGSYNKRGRVEIYSGIDGQLLYGIDGENPGDFFGLALTDAGDLNGDNYDDFVIGAARTGYGGQNAGSVYAYSGVDGSLLWQVNGGSAYDRLGASLDRLGDINNDGVNDFVVGAIEKTYVDRPGSAYVISGVDGTLLHQFVGEGNKDEFGTAVGGVGDVNNDGYPDIAVGAPYTDYVPNNSGSVYVYSGKDYSQLYRFDGAGNGEGMGAIVSGLGDVNNDGYDDFAAGNGGLIDVRSGVDGVVLYSLSTQAWGSSSAGSGILENGVVDAYGDFNGDGYDDFVLSNNNTGCSEAGCRKVNIHSGIDGVILRAYNDSFRSVNRFGSSLSVIGDVDGDGLKDIIVGGRRDGFYISGWNGSGWGCCGNFQLWSGSAFVITQSIDSDADGMADWFEQETAGLDYLVDDALGDVDSDGVTNIDEYYVGTVVNDSDTDNDGALDGVDAFVFDPAEQLDTDNDGVGNNADTDDDNDNMPDDWELANGLDPLVVDSGEDPDGDSYTNLAEYYAGTDPNVAEATTIKEDTDGDHDSDIIWRNRNTGEMTIWSMTDANIDGSVVIGGLGPDFDLIDTNDLDADGDSDLVLFRQSDGRAVKWEMENHAKVSGSLLGGFSGYTILKLGDVDADGDPDIIWQNKTTGIVIIWIMENGVKQSGNFLGTLGSGAEVVAVGDFDSDGDMDLIWKVPGITTLIRWDLENGTKLAGAAIGGFDGYSISTVGNVMNRFEDTATDDLVWTKDGGGLVIVWRMLDGVKFNGYAFSAPAGYKAEITGNYGGSNDEGLLLSNDAGDARIWWFHGWGALSDQSIVGTKDANSDVRP